MSKLVFLRKNGYGTSLRDNGFNTVKPNQIRKFNRLSPDIVWRWGFSGVTDFVEDRSDNFPSNVLVINKSRHIRKISDKYGFLQICKENDVRVPDFYLADEICCGVEGLDSVYLGRKFNHFGGKDIKVIESEEDILEDDQSDFYVKFIPKIKEFRVYTFFGRVIEVQEKIPENRNNIAWNHRQGSKFVNVKWSNWPSKACYFAIKCANLFKIDYCAFDIILGEDHKYYVLEGNTAPTISGEYNLSILRDCVDYLEDYFDENGTLPEFYQDVEFVRGYENYIHPLMTDYVLDEI